MATKTERTREGKRDAKWWTKGRGEARSEAARAEATEARIEDRGKCEVERGRAIDSAGRGGGSGGLRHNPEEAEGRVPGAASRTTRSLPPRSASVIVRPRPSPPPLLTPFHPH